MTIAVMQMMGFAMSRDSVMKAPTAPIAMNAAVALATRTRAPTLAMESVMISTVIASLAMTAPIAITVEAAKDLSLAGLRPMMTHAVTLTTKCATNHLIAMWARTAAIAAIAGEAWTTPRAPWTTLAAIAMMMNATSHSIATSARIARIATLQVAQRTNQGVVEAANLKGGNWRRCGSE